MTMGVWSFLYPLVMFRYKLGCLVRS